MLVKKEELQEQAYTAKADFFPSPQLYAMVATREGRELEQQGLLTFDDAIPKSTPVNILPKTFLPTPFSYFSCLGFQEGRSSPNIYR